MSAYLCTQIDAYMYLQLNDLWTLCMCVCACACVREFNLYIWLKKLPPNCLALRVASTIVNLPPSTHPTHIPYTITHWHTYNTHTHSDTHAHSLSYRLATGNEIKTNPFVPY